VDKPIANRRVRAPLWICSINTVSKLYRSMAVRIDDPVVSAIAPSGLRSFFIPEWKLRGRCWGIGKHCRPLPEEQQLYCHLNLASCADKGHKIILYEGSISNQALARSSCWYRARGDLNDTAYLISPGGSIVCFPANSVFKRRGAFATLSQPGHSGLVTTSCII